jgi:beta-carotene isomerase
MINFESSAGISNNKSGFDSLVEAATMASQKFNTIQQQEVILDALDRAFPKPILSLVSSIHFLFSHVFLKFEIINKLLLANL